MVCMYLYEVWMRLRVCMSVQALYGEVSALYRKSFESQNSTHLTLLKYQNTKTALYELIGLLHFLKFLGLSETDYLLGKLSYTF